MANQFLIDSQKKAYGFSAAQNNSTKTNTTIPDAAKDTGLTPPANPGTTTVNKGPTPPVLNAANNNGQTPPALGYGGATYGTDAATNKALVENANRLKTDPEFANSEKIRTATTIKEREAAGLDTSAQVKYLKSLGGEVLSETPAVSTTPAGSQNGTAYSSTYTGPDMAGMTNQVDAINSNSYAAQLQLLKQALQTKQQGLDTEAAAAKQNAYETANQTDATNLQNEQRMKETMANAGLTTDGQNLTLQAAQNSSRLGALTDINNQRDAKLQDISGQRSVANNNAAANELALKQGLDAQTAAQMLDLMKYGDTMAYQVDQSNYGRYADQRDFNYGSSQDKIQNEAQYGGTYNGEKTVDQKELDWNKSELNPAVKLQVWQANLAKQEAINYPEKTKLEIQQIKQDVALGKVDLDTAKYKLNQLTDPKSVTNQLNELSVTAAQLGNQELKKRIAEIGKMPTLTANEKRMQELELEKAQIEVDDMKKPKPGATAEEYAKYLDGMVKRDSDGVMLTDIGSIEDAILESGLAASEKTKLYLRYGIPLGDSGK